MHHTVDNRVVVIAPATSRAILSKRYGLNTRKAAQSVEQRAIELEILRCARCLLRRNAENQ
jgi:hypothetical protein